MKADRPILDRVPPRLQKEWDIRGALNFICGGAGGGVLAITALVPSVGLDLRPLIALGLVLVAAGLFAVWLKIGRPWRALYVVRRPSTSWMSREAWLAPFVFGCGAFALWSGSDVATWLLGALGLVFAYAQGRILKANIGIPAWRRWSCVVLIVITALTEGAGLVCLAAIFLPTLRPFGYALAAFVVVRFLAWLYYRADLKQAGVPVGATAALDSFGPAFVWAGHVCAALLAFVGAYTAEPLLLAAGAVFAVVAGALLKYVLVCKAAFTQGFSLPRTPSRGKGKSTPGIQPGWEQAKGG